MADVDQLQNKSLEDLGRLKIVQEIANLSLQEDKAKLEVEDLRRGFFRRANAPALISMIATLVALGIAGYTAKLGIEKLRLLDLASDNQKLQGSLANLTERTEAAKKEKAQFETDLLNLGKQKENAEGDLRTLGEKTAALERSKSLLESLIGFKQGENERLRDVQNQLVGNVKSEKVRLMAQYIDSCLDKFSSKACPDLIAYYDEDEGVQPEFRRLFSERYLKANADYRDSSLVLYKTRNLYMQSAAALILYRVTRDPRWKETLETLTTEHIENKYDTNADQEMFNVFYGIGGMLLKEDVDYFGKSFIRLAERHMNSPERQAGSQDEYIALQALNASQLIGRLDNEVTLRYLSELRREALEGNTWSISMLSFFAPGASLVYSARVLATGGSLSEEERRKLLGIVNSALRNNSDLANTIPGYASDLFAEPHNIRVLQGTDWSRWLSEHDDLVQVWITDDKLQRLRTDKSLFNKHVNWRSVP